MILPIFARQVESLSQELQELPWLIIYFSYQKQIKPKSKLKT